MPVGGGGTGTGAGTVIVQLYVVVAPPTAATARECVPGARPVTFFGEAHASGAPPSRAQIVAAPPVTVQPKLAVVSAVVAGGVVVNVTVATGGGVPPPPPPPPVPGDIITFHATVAAVDDPL